MNIDLSSETSIVADFPDEELRVYDIGYRHNGRDFKICNMIAHRVYETEPDQRWVRMAVQIENNMSQSTPIEILSFTVRDYCPRFLVKGEAREIKFA